MLRNLYRFYLYAVFIAMVIFAASGVFQFLQTMLGLTSLRGQNTPPSNAAVTQAVVYALVALLVAVMIGGLHYWLMRRDMRDDADAGNGGVRAFFLNALELVSYITGVSAGISVIGSFGQQYPPGLNIPCALAITSLCVWGVADLERRRAPAVAGAAVVFQRLHFYGAQLVLLGIITFYWLGTVGQAIDDVVFQGRGAGLTPCGGFTVCPGANLLSESAALFWIVLFWLGYGYLSRKDTGSLLRRVLHYLSFGYGLIFVIVGVYRAASLLVLSMLGALPGQNQISGPYAPYDSVAPLSFGALACAIYLYWLRGAMRQQPPERAVMTLIVNAIAAIVAGVVFWWGCGSVILNLLNQIMPTSPLSPGDWANAWALLIGGVAYLPLDVILRRRTAQSGFVAPLRGFVLALLGVGIVAGAIGGATALYFYGTAGLGVQSGDWQFAAHTGLAALIIGALLAVIYLRIARREHLIGVAPKPPAPSAITSPMPEEVSTQPAVAPQTEETSPVVMPAPQAAPERPVPQIVDALLAGTISRDEAVAQLEGLNEVNIP
mgnify:CR=1 FL=1